MNFMQNVMCTFKNYILNKFISLHLNKVVFLSSVKKHSEYDSRKKFYHLLPLSVLAQKNTTLIVAAII